MKLSEVIKTVFSWRIATIIIAILAIPLIPINQGSTVLNSFFTFPDIINMWTNFDGIPYTKLAEWGYGYPLHTDKLYSFFPVYPWTIQFFNLFNNYVFTSLAVSLVCLIASFYFLYKLLRLDFSPKVSRLTLVIMLIFPTSFFFGAAYSESLFLLLTVLAFYFIRSKHTLLAVIVACIASATRVTGILLWPVLLYEYYLENSSSLKKMFKPELILFLIPPMGLLSFMRFQIEKTGDALNFVNSQTNFGVGGEIDKITLLHQVIFRYVKMMIFIDHSSAVFFTVFLEFLVGMSFIGLIFYSYKKLRLSYFMYSGLSVLLPTLTGTFTGLPRFVIVLFPLFAIIATILEKQKPTFKKIYFILNILLTVIAISLFTRGYFIG